MQLGDRIAKVIGGTVNEEKSAKVILEVFPGILRGRGGFPDTALAVDDPFGYDSRTTRLRKKEEMLLSVPTLPTNLSVREGSFCGELRAFGGRA